jgi:hypothetical protein
LSGWFAVAVDPLMNPVGGWDGGLFVNEREISWQF